MEAFQNAKRSTLRPQMGFRQHDSAEPLLVRPEQEPPPNDATANSRLLRPLDDHTSNSTSREHPEPTHDEMREVDRGVDRDEKSTLLPGGNAESGSDEISPNEAVRLRVDWKPFWLR